LKARRYLAAFEQLLINLNTGIKGKRSRHGRTEEKGVAITPQQPAIARCVEGIGLC